MFAPPVTPGLAERALIGAAVHAFSRRARRGASAEDRRDLDFARQVTTPDELAESGAVYAITLVWWAQPDRTARRDLLAEATALMLQQVAASTAERDFEAGYRIFASRLTELAMAPRVTADELDVSPLVSGVGEIDRLTARFADTTAHAVLLSDSAVFGDPVRSAELMRDQLIQLAFCA